MLEHLKAPVKAIVGAWHHSYPHDAYPKPQIEWRHEAVRWFDQWLKGRDTGILEEPRLAVYVRRWHPPGPVLEEAPGEWRYEDGWPIAPHPRAALLPAAEPLPRRGRAEERDPSAEERSLDRRSRPAVPSCGSATSPRTSGRPTPSASSTTREPRRGGPRDPGPAQGAAPGVRGRAARPLVRAALRRRPRRHRHARGQRRPERRPPRVRREPESARAGPGVPPRDRAALHVVDLPEGPSPAHGRPQRPVADDLALALPGDHDPAPRRGHADPASGRSLRGAAAAGFPASGSERASGSPATAP